MKRRIVLRCDFLYLGMKALAMKKQLIYCGGEFIETGEVLEVENPYTHRVFAHTYKAGDQHLEKAIKSARKAESALKAMPGYQRYQALMYIARGLEKRAEEFAETLCLESAKPIRYARGEIQRAIQTFRIAAEESKRIPGEYLQLDWTPPGEGREGWVKYFPVGLVAGISPFNFPLNLAVHKIAPAIASGCPIILKPSSSTPLSTLLLASLISKTGLPKGAVSILPMDRATGNLLVTDERFKLLTFTGSPGVGWKMKQQAGKKKVVLELGGNAGVIITKSADLQRAAEKCLVGGFAYSGQVCIHAQRIYVAKEVFKAFCDLFVPMVESLRQGDPLDPETEVSSMIDEANALRVEQWVGEAIDGGARLLAGGRRKESYFEPTLLTQTHNQMKVCTHEIFGPVVTIEAVEDLHEAVRLVNDTRFGLQTGIFTNHIKDMDYAFNHLEVGGVILNDVPTFRVDHMPYGGVKDSGLGREGVKYAMQDMLEPRILVKNR